MTAVGASGKAGSGQSERRKGWLVCSHHNHQNEVRDNTAQTATGKIEQREQQQTAKGAQQRGKVPRERGRERARAACLVLRSGLFATPTTTTSPSVLAASPLRSWYRQDQQRVIGGPGHALPLFSFHPYPSKPSLARHSHIGQLPSAGWLCTHRRTIAATAAADPSPLASSPTYRPLELSFDGHFALRCCYCCCCCCCCPFSLDQRAHLHRQFPLLCKMLSFSTRFLQLLAVTSALAVTLAASGRSSSPGHYKVMLQRSTTPSHSLHLHARHVDDTFSTDTTHLLRRRRRRRRPQKSLPRILAEGDARTLPSLARRNIVNDLLFSSSSIIAPLQVGTPPQNVWVLLDTASADLALFDSDYASQFDPSSDAFQQTTGTPFHSSLSSTYKGSSDVFTNNYGGGTTATSFTAVKSSDTVAFETLMLSDQPLGVIHKGNVSYGPKTAGIMGLAFESASEGLRSTPVVQQLYFAGALKEPVFTFALMRPSTASETTATENVTQPGGIFTLGVVDQSQYKGTLGWGDVVSTTKGSSQPGKWLAKLDGIAVNGKDVSAAKGAVANFDTGSSASRASEAFVDALVANVDGAYKDKAGNYYVPCGKDTPPAMNVTLTMGGTSVEIEPLDLLYKTTLYTASTVSAATVDTTYCTATLSQTDADGYDIQIGDDILRSLFVAFSFAPPRVGIAEQADAVRGQGAAPLFAFSGAPSTLKSAHLIRVEAPASGVQLVSSQAVDAAAATAHVSANDKGNKLARGGTLRAGHTATMEGIVASSTAYPLRAAATTGDVADAAAAASAPMNTDGIVRSPTASSNQDASSGAAATSTRLAAAAYLPAVLTLAAMLAGSLVVAAAA